MEITARSLARLSGAAAIAGGAARVVMSFVPWAPNQPILEAAYATIDILLMFGLFGAYLVRARALGVLGLLAFALSGSALSFIGGPDADVFGFGTYQAGAAALSIGMTLLGAVALARRAMPVWAPACWMGSLAMGIVSGALGGASWAFVVAGALFGAGFVAAGIDTIRRPAGASGDI